MRVRVITVAILLLGLLRPVLAESPLDTAAYSYVWRDLYVGAQGGFDWSNNPTELTGDPIMVSSLIAYGVYPSSLAASPKSALGGIEGGMNVHVGRLVLGPEIDYSLASIKQDQSIETTSGSFLPIYGTTTASLSLNWLATARVRAGYSITDALMVFATGGLALGKAKVAVSNMSRVATPTVTPICYGFGSCLSGSSSGILQGWALGGGFEYGAGAWSVKLEYLHYDLGKMSFAYADALTPIASITASTRFSGDILRLGVNFHFDRGSIPEVR